ncbi:MULTISPECIES: hypothetical protein [unclassified Paenibacillus]|uniref:Uncharacterized protein n=1 Tax=Paenibacillus provencensis TaxID=441151 RepID=A0ABW3PKH9_9BACL|nr:MULTISPECIES: hypothetical protein [unclassified Paenibacillus]MCM3129056.1 hypothetical protein [Paenibacillus sp. MER 78]SFS51179.1 hypothetical protein SAMN04488601_1011263 [Paenibacillus sp. 453mf]
MSTQRERQLMFQCEHETADYLKKYRQYVKESCEQFMNHDVSIQTLDGETFEGTIVNVDPHHVYIRVHEQRGFGGPGFGPGFGPGGPGFGPGGPGLGGPGSGWGPGGGNGPYGPGHGGPGFGPGPGYGPGFGSGPNPNVILPLTLFNLLTLSLLI